MKQLAEGKRVWNSSKTHEANGVAPEPKPKSRKSDKSLASQRVTAKPKFIEPMKARTQEAAPPGEWLYEVKFDGFRAVAYKKAKTVNLLSRTNHELTQKFPEITEALDELRATDAIVDGEIVALDKEGCSSFQLLQACELGQARPPLCYYAFDLLALRGKSTCDLPLEERREKLKEILPASSGTIRFSASLGGHAKSLLVKAASLGLEGLIGKRAGSAYEPGRRGGAWIKLKLVSEQEFVIGGYTDPTGARQHIGALLVGVYEKKKLVYSGKVGTGFNDAALRQFYKQFKPMEQKTCAFSDLPETRKGRYGQGITTSL